MVVPAELFDVSPRMLQVKCATFLSEVSLIFILSLALFESICHRVIPPCA